MANLTKSGTNWTGTVTLSKSSSTLTIPTKDKYVDKDVSMTLNVKSGSAKTPATTITANPSLSTTKETNGYKMSVSKTQDVTPTVSAGWVASGTKGTITVSGSAYVPAAAGSITMTAGSGSVTGSNATLSSTNTSNVSVTGKGSVSATAKITTAGYTPTNTSFATGASTSSNGSTKYITGITLGKGYQFDITNAVLDKVTVKYNSSTNSLDFVFA